MTRYFFFTRRFLPLFITQFLGAFNDNLFKTAVMMVLTYTATKHGNTHSAILVPLAAGLFIFPYFVFSTIAGQVADRYDRARIARILKISETLLMVSAAFALMFQHIPAMLAVLFGMGIQSAFFGPIKYALLPQHLHTDELLPGNGWVQAGTFAAILTGTVLGGLIAVRDGGALLTGLLAISFAVLGYGAARAIPPAPAPDATTAIALRGALRQHIAQARQNPRVWQAIKLVNVFWFIGAAVLALLPTLTRDRLNGDETVVTLFLTLFSIGIGLGAWAGNTLLHRLRQERIVIRSASVAMGLSLALFAGMVAIFPAPTAMMKLGEFLTHPAGWGIGISLLGLAISGGIYALPLQTRIQREGEATILARLIATLNALNALAMAAASLLLMALAAFGAPYPLQLALIAISCLYPVFLRQS